MPSPRDHTLPRVSRPLVSLFTAYARLYLRRHFHAVRLLRLYAPPADPGQHRPMVIYLNHPGWWDPMVCILAAKKFLPSRTGYGPIAAEALAKYGFFRRLGFFGVDRSRRGAGDFLAIGAGVLDQPRSALWITAQGAFTDPRVRPAALEPGLAHLLRRRPDALVIPMAIEYPHWTERTPEALLAFGPPVDAADAPSVPATTITARLAGALEAAQNALAAAAIARDPAAFTTILRGSAGVGGVYDLYRRSLARLLGRDFTPEHGE